MILQIALDTPLRRVFDYRPPAKALGVGTHDAPRPGVRVRVPFGRQQLIGILVGVASESAVAAPKLKAALEILDEHPIVDPVTFDLLCWAAEMVVLERDGTTRIVGSQRPARSAAAGPARLACAKGTRHHR